MMRLFNFNNVIEKPTRVTNYSRTLLYPIIVSDTINYVFADVFKLRDNISDHDASVVILQCSKNISRSFKREIWHYQKFITKSLKKNQMKLTGMKNLTT